MWPKARTEHADLYFGRTQKRVWHLFTLHGSLQICVPHARLKGREEETSRLLLRCRINEKENRSKINSPVSPPFWSERGRGGCVTVSSRQAEGPIRCSQGMLGSTCLVPQRTEGCSVLVSRRLRFSPPHAQHSQSEEKRAHSLKQCGLPGHLRCSTPGSCGTPGSPSRGGRWQRLAEQSTSLAEPASARRPCSTRGHNCAALSS